MFRRAERQLEHSATCRRRSATAIRAARKMWIAYQDGDGRSTERIIQPFTVAYYVGATLICAWCELRNDVRHFPHPPGGQRRCARPVVADIETGCERESVARCADVHFGINGQVSREGHLHSAGRNPHRAYKARD